LAAALDSQEGTTMSFWKHTHESGPAVDMDETDEAFEGFVEALGVLGPELLRNPDAWISLSDTDSLQAGLGNLARVPLLTERWN
jgi:hypothetical protein